MHPRLAAALLAAALLPAAQLLYPGCATVVNGPTQQVRVKSQPSGARVFLNGQDRGLTPVTIKVSRWGSHRVRIEMTGFQPFETPLVKYGTYNTLGNAYLGYAPILIDALSGAIFTLGVPPSVEKQMIPSSKQAPDNMGDSPRDTLVIAVVLKPDPAWRKVGQLQRR